ncbi:hypothetical protein MgSA37_02520 [Mucilaginibacter gotjawali]|nr:hypothetical protein MgSA37_02520 [Mucilaginibacter gotjawali]
MKKNYTLKKYSFCCTLIAFNTVFCTPIFAQSDYMPYSYQFYQKANVDLYSTGTREHTSMKPFFAGDSLLKIPLQSMIRYNTKGQKNDWGYKKLYTEHLVDIKSGKSSFYADLLPDFTVGRDFSGHKTISITSLGFQMGGSHGNKFYYNISGYAATAIQPEYMAIYTRQTGIVTGQAYDRTLPQNPAWYYFTAIASYTPSKFLNIAAGRDKTFIGDGYRSMLLSDFASPNPFFKLTGTLGSLRYMVMWAYMNDPATTSPYGINRKKFGVFHYLDWNISKRLSFGFFDNVIGFFTDDNGVKRPFDFNYINPIIFTKPVNNSSDDPDKSLLGFTGKYKVSNGLTVYGQFALNEFHSADFFSSNGSSVNKYGWQLGFRATNLFEVDHLNLLLETNNAKPYTYSARSAIENYSENGEPLAHPWGANFREILGLLNYSYKRFDFSGETDFGRYGFDLNTLDYGKNIFEIYTNAARQYGNYTVQGLTTNMIYVEGKVAYVLNPRYNLRFELGGTLRVEKNSQFNNKASMIIIGLRSSFRELYTDLASYKMH